MKRNNHYNSQMYLKAWECEKNKTMVYDLLVSDERVPMWSKKSIENLCSIENLFVRLENQRETDDIENWFEYRYETPAKLVLEKAINGEKINWWEMHKLVDFMACHIVRPPVFIEKILKKGKNEIKEIFEKECNNISNISKEEIKREIKIEDANSSLFPFKMEKIKDDEENELWKIETIIGKQFYLWTMKCLLENTAEELHKHNWSILTAHPYVKFPTSDDPVICLNYCSDKEYNFGGGWGRKNGNIIFPISPNKLLFTQIGISHNKNTNLNYEESLRFKKLIIEHAHRKIISSYADKEITFIRKRCVDRDMFNYEKNIWKNFQEAYINTESKYIK